MIAPSRTEENDKKDVDMYALAYKLNGLWLSKKFEQVLAIVLAVKGDEAEAIKVLQSG